MSTGNGGVGRQCSVSPTGCYGPYLVVAIGVTETRVFRLPYASPAASECASFNS